MTSPEGSRLGVLIRQLQGQGVGLEADLAALAAEFAARPRLSWGTSTITFSNAVSGTVVVTHSLGVAPTGAFATAHTTGDGRNDYVMNSGSSDASVIYFTIRAAAGEDFPMGVGTPVDFDWIVFA